MRENYLIQFRGISTILILVILSSLVFSGLKYYFRDDPNKGLSLKLDDIVRGTIISDISEVHQAYEHFSQTPGVEVIAVRE